MNKVPTKTEGWAGGRAEQGTNLTLQTLYLPVDPYQGSDTFHPDTAPDPADSCYARKRV